MDTHGLTLTNTFIHAQLGMNKTPDAFGMKIYNQKTAIGLFEVFIGPNHGRETVCVGLCGSVAKKSLNSDTLFVFIFSKLF